MIDKKFFHLTLRALKSNFLEITPYKLTFAITYLCNSRCKYCSIWKIKPRGELSLDEIEKFAKYNNFFSWINITGGEPFLRSDIIDIIEAFGKNNKDLYVVNTTTNSFNPTYILNKVKEMLEIKIPKFIVVVSLDGIGKIDDKIRGVKHFTNAITLYKDLKKLELENSKLKVYIGYTITPLNLGRLRETVVWLKKNIEEFDTNNFHVNFFHFSSHYYHNLNAISNQKYSKYLSQVISEIEWFLKVRKKEVSAPDILDFLFTSNIKKHILNKNTMKCKVLDSSIFLDPWGNVYPCTIWGINLGNIREYNFSIKKILKTERIKELKKLIRLRKCPWCWTVCEAYQTILGNLLKII